MSASSTSIFSSAESWLRASERLDALGGGGSQVFADLLGGLLDQLQVAVQLHAEVAGLVVEEVGRSRARSVRAGTRRRRRCRSAPSGLLRGRSLRRSLQASRGCRSRRRSWRACIESKPSPTPLANSSSASGRRSSFTSLTGRGYGGLAGDLLAGVVGDGDLDLFGFALLRAVQPSRSRGGGRGGLRAGAARRRRPCTPRAVDLDGHVAADDVARLDWAVDRLVDGVAAAELVDGACRRRLRPPLGSRSTRTEA